MTDLYIPDISEFQGTVNWKALIAGAYPAAIIRAHNGSRADHQWAANRASAHANGIKALGIYQYIQAGLNIVTQANGLCDLIGTLKPGEWAICDLEEGTGDQSTRAHEWYTTVAGRLHNAASEELYSGDYFFGAHHLSAAGFKRIWLAAYSTTEPKTAHEMWQFTDARHFPGISGNTDGSVFHGTIDQLLSHINAPVTVPAPPPIIPTEENEMYLLTVNEKDYPKGGWPGVFVWTAAGTLKHVVGETDDLAQIKKLGMKTATISKKQYDSLMAGH